MKAAEGEFDRFDPANVAAVACWLASPLADGLSGQVVQVQGGQVQLLEGWRPLTAVSTDKPWTIDTVEAVRSDLLAKSDGSIPAFFFGPPSPDRVAYPAAGG
jgi:hypothetical protein